MVDYPQEQLMAIVKRAGIVEAALMPSTPIVLVVVVEAHRFGVWT